jgi:hypothetical protein
LKELGLLALLSVAAVAPSVRAAPLHATIYFQVVRPTQDLSPHVDRWLAQVKANLQRHVNDMVEEINSHIPNVGSRISLHFNRDIYIDNAYQDPELSQLSVHNNSIEVSVVENFKDGNKIRTRTDVYFGALKGALDRERIVYTEDSALDAPDRSADALKYIFTYAWAMDLADNGRPLLACPLLDRAIQLESRSDIRTSAGLAPLRAAVHKSYADPRLGCAQRLRDANG